MSASVLHSSTSAHFYFTLARFRDSCQEELRFLVSIRMFVFFNGEQTKSLFVL